MQTITRPIVSDALLTSLKSIWSIDEEQIYTKLKELDLELKISDKIICVDEGDTNKKMIFFFFGIEL